jgi:hypothetical protein
MYGIPDSPPSAVALVAAVSKGVDSRYSPLIEEFAAVLEDAHTLAPLSWTDAHSVTEIIVKALTESAHPAKLLRDYAENSALSQGRFLNQYKARRALRAAAKLYSMRVYGYRGPVRYQQAKSYPPIEVIRQPQPRRAT